MENVIKCTAPGCGFEGIAWAMWLPANAAMVAANGGKRVVVNDFPKFAVCGRHGHLLRKSGIKVYRYLQTVEREEAFAARRSSQGQWNAFANRFQTPANAKQQPLIKRARDGQNVSTGLSACSQLDAKKPRSPKTDSDSAPTDRKDESAAKPT